ncbi:MAG: hypothetical protein FWD53_11050, partial [Phycisphaerales bacterium]|nr:hypothetical protein [Phycisphaerales bacterium]
MKRCVLCVVLLVVVGLGGGVWANDDGWGDGSTSTKKPTVARPPANTPPPPREGPVDPTDPTIVPVEVTHLIAAKKILTKAQGDYDAFVAVKKAEFEGASEFVTAKSALEESERALVALKAPLQEKLRATDSAYAAAVKGLEGATQKLDEATATKKADEIA